MRSGALVAGAAVGALAVASTTEVAHAADGDSLLVGAGNESDSLTSLRIGATDGSGVPALSLTNVDGPTLRLDPLPAGWTGELEVGDLAGTPLGPIVGVDSSSGVATTFLVTGADLAGLATPFTAAPSRVLDLRTAPGRTSIIRRSSASPLSAAGRLRAGEWVDVGIVQSGDDYDLQGLFANLTVTGALGAGFVSAYPPGVRPSTSSINFTAGQTIANFAVVGLGLVQGWHTVRLYAHAETWIILDITGGISAGNSQAPLGKAMANRRQGGRRALVDKLRTAFTRAGR